MVELRAAVPVGVVLVAAAAVLAVYTFRTSREPGT